MIAILEAPEVRQRALPITVETYHWMIENGLVAKRAELIRGVIVEKMSKSSLHTFLVNEFRDRLAAVLGTSWLIRKEDPITLGDSEPEPDIAVVSGTNADFAKANPTTARLIVEIAVSSEASDREMIKAYAEAGVEECWLVLAKQQVVEVFTSPADGQYQIRRVLTVEDTLTAESLPGVVIELNTLFPR